MEPVELATERLTLSAPVPADIDAIARYCQDPLFERYMTTPWPYTRDDAAWFVERFVPAGWEHGVELTWALRAAPEAELMGVIGWRSATGDVGFWMGAEHRGQGYMAEALRTVVEWVFVERDVPSIAWESFAGNEASARVARGAGFRFTGEGPVRLPARDGSRPNGWHGELAREDDRDLKDGWPL